MKEPSFMSDSQRMEDICAIPQACRDRVLRASSSTNDLGGCGPSGDFVLK
jgi:hypothetical protein